MSTRLPDVIAALDRLPSAIERELDARVRDLERPVRRSARVRDELERAIEDLDDDALRHRMRRLLTELDDVLSGLTDDARAISAYDLFDPIRVLSADLRLDAAQTPLEGLRR